MKLTSNSIMLMVILLLLLRSAVTQIGITDKSTIRRGNSP